MESARPLPSPHGGTTRSTTPILPPSQARPAPKLERRAVEISLAAPPPTRRTSMRAYLFGAAMLAAISVAGWFALGEYIYG